MARSNGEQDACKKNELLKSLFPFESTRLHAHIIYEYIFSSSRYYVEIRFQKCLDKPNFESHLAFILILI